MSDKIEKAPEEVNLDALLEELAKAGAEIAQAYLQLNTPNGTCPENLLYSLSMLVDSLAYLASAGELLTGDPNHMNAAIERLVDIRAELERKKTGRPIDVVQAALQQLASNTEEPVTSKSEVLGKAGFTDRQITELLRRINPGNQYRH